MRPEKPWFGAEGRGFDSRHLHQWICSTYPSRPRREGYVLSGIWGTACVGDPFARHDRHRPARSSAGRHRRRGRGDFCDPRCGAELRDVLRPAVSEGSCRRSATGHGGGDAQRPVTDSDAVRTRPGRAPGGGRRRNAGRALDRNRRDRGQGRGPTQLLRPREQGRHRPAVGQAAFRRSSAFRRGPSRPRVSSLCGPVVTGNQIRVVADEPVPPWPPWPSLPVRSGQTLRRSNRRLGPTL